MTKDDMPALKEKVHQFMAEKLKEEGYQQNWPEEIEMTAEIKTKVDNKWDNLFKG